MTKHDKDINLLNSLLEIPSPSGFERNLSIFIKNYLSKILSKNQIEIDFHNNVVVTIKGRSDKTIMLDAHLDELGFLIKNIEKDGYISLVSIGGRDATLLRGRNITIISNKGNINGVIGTKPIHLIDDEKKEQPEYTYEVTVDVGIRKKKEIEKYFNIGDPVILKSNFVHLLGDNYSGAGFDDKAGCFVLIKTIEQIIKSKINPINTLKITFSSQEELGCKGALELVNRYKPNLFIGVDVGFATDTVDTSEREVGKFELGKGIAMHRGINIYKPVNELLLRIAKEYRINTQLLATTGHGTNAGYVANKEGGIKVLDLGIPLRYMHSSIEVINIEDLLSGSNLITKLLLSKRLGSILK
jgi:endoglucanase